jgi:hypothetical protein
LDRVARIGDGGQRSRALLIEFGFLVRIELQECGVSSLDGCG